MNCRATTRELMNDPIFLPFILKTAEMPVDHHSVLKPKLHRNPTCSQMQAEIVYY